MCDELTADNKGTTDLCFVCWPQRACFHDTEHEWEEVEPRKKEEAVRSAGEGSKSETATSTTSSSSDSDSSSDSGSDSNSDSDTE